MPFRWMEAHSLYELKMMNKLSVVVFFLSIGLACLPFTVIQYIVRYVDLKYRKLKISIAH